MSKVADMPIQPFWLLEAYVEAVVSQRVAEASKAFGPGVKERLEELKKHRFLARQRLQEALTGTAWVPETWEAEFEAGKSTPAAKKTKPKASAPVVEDHDDVG